MNLKYTNLPLFVTTKFEMLATLKWNLFSVLALSTFHPQYNFLGSLGLDINNKLIT